MDKTADKKTLIIDLDEVIIEKFTHYLLKEYNGIDLFASDFKGQFIQDIFKTDKEREDFYKFMFSKNNVYDSIPLLDGVRGALEKLNEKYALYICSDYLIKGYEWGSDKLLADKTAMLKSHFPFINPSQYIFMRNKHLLKADILIDDRPGNFGPYIGRKLLFTAYHNADMTPAELKKLNFTRVDNWAEICGLLL